MQAPMPPVVAFLGYTGLIPFVAPVLAALLGWSPWPFGPSWSIVQLSYGAVILSFLGALHWGVAMTSQRLDDATQRFAYLWSVIPSLFAWVALLLAGSLGSLLLSLVFVLQWIMDRRLQAVAQLPDWFIPLRTRLTVGAVASLVALVLIPQ